MSDVAALNACVGLRGSVAKIISAVSAALANAESGQEILALSADSVEKCGVGTILGLHRVVLNDNAAGVKAFQARGKGDFHLNFFV